MSMPVVVVTLIAFVLVATAGSLVVGLRERRRQTTARRVWRARARASYAEARWVHDRATLVAPSGEHEASAEPPAGPRTARPSISERLMVRDRARHLVDDLRRLEREAPGADERDAVREVTSAVHATSRALQAAGTRPEAVPPGRWHVLLARFRLALDALADALPRASWSRPSPG